MTTLLVTHSVKDPEFWLASEKRAEFFGPLGVTNIRTFINQQDRSKVGVIIDVPDIDKLKAALASPSGIAAMNFDGVLPETVVIHIES
jgi:hypothetical protein